MSWEDAIFSAAQVCFSVSLIGMVRATAKPPLWSAAMYAGWVWAITVADIGLGLPFATVTAAASAVLWTLLAVQSARTKNHLTPDLNPDCEFCAKWGVPCFGGEYHRSASQA